MTARNMVRKFLQLETAGGFLLMAALGLAILAENSSFKPWYDLIFSTRFEIALGDFKLGKPLLLWVNDALMAVFFFLVGLELKREVLEGQLSSPSKILLPAIAAVGGIVAPAVIYVFVNSGNEAVMNGWAIPTATDIAFALGVMALLGSRVPAGLKLFLLAVAIIDDIGAIVIIAVFYSGDLSPAMFAVSAAALAVLAFMNRRGVATVTPYLAVGVILWVAVLKSGIHATLAGILLAMFIPLKKLDGQRQSMLVKLEHDLHGTVAFVILPIFAFANAGINLSGLKLVDLAAPVPLGIAAGLVLGKQLGVFGTVLVAVKSGLAKLPDGVNWVQMYGLSVLCGIGFTMSLFISSLAFETGGEQHTLNDRLGIVVGSLVSAVLGYAILRIFTKPAKSA